MTTPTPAPTPAAASPFPPVRRVVTGHTPAGRATVLRDAPQPAHRPSAHSANVAHALHRTDAFPAAQDSELRGAWDDGAARGAGAVSAQGSVFVAFDLAPGSSSPFHRTVSLDYGVVAHGTVVLELDDGERVVLRAGDTVVQRGTAHAWHNESGEWARMYFVVLGAQPITVGGETLQEDWNVARSGRL